MKFIAALFFLSCVSPLVAEDVDLGTTHNPYTEETCVFRIDSSRLKGLPEWDGISEKVPLSINDAIRSATARARADYPNKLNGIRTIFLLRRKLTTGQSLWTYSISFRLSDSEARQSASYVVLLDGTVVSAVPLKKAR